MNSDPRTRLLVVGNGMAGARTVEEILKRGAEKFDVTMIGDEPYGNYNRIMLSHVLAGESGVDDRQRPDVLHGRPQICTGELGDGLVQALAQPGDARRAAVQVEDRGADLLDDFLEIIDTAHEPLLHLRCP